MNQDAHPFNNVVVTTTTTATTTIPEPVERHQEQAFEGVVHDLDKQHTVKPAAVGNVNPLEKAAVAVHAKFEEVKENAAGEKRHQDPAHEEELRKQAKVGEPVELRQKQAFEDVVHDLDKQHTVMPSAVGNVNPLEKAAVAVHEKFEEFKEMVTGAKHDDAKDNVLLNEYAVSGKGKLSTAAATQTNSVPLSEAQAHDDVTQQVNSSVPTTSNAPIEQRQEHAFENVVHDLDKQHTVKPVAVGNVNPLEHAAVAVHEKFQEVKEKVVGDKYDNDAEKQDNPLFKEYAVAGKDKLSTAMAAQVNSVPVSVAEAHEKLTNEVNSSVVPTEDTVSAVHTGIASNTQVFTADTTAASLNLKSTAPEQVQKITAEHDKPLNVAHDQVASQVDANVTTMPATVPDQAVTAAREQVAAEVATTVSTVPATVQATGAAAATTPSTEHKHNPFRDFFAKLFAKKPESAKTGLVPAANPTDVHEEHTTTTTTAVHTNEENKHHHDSKVKEFFHKLKLWFTKPHTPTTDLATSSKPATATTTGNVTASVEPMHDKKAEEIKVQVNQEVLEEVRPNNATAAADIPSTAQTVVTAN